MNEYSNILDIQGANIFYSQSWIDKYKIWLPPQKVKMSKLSTDDEVAAYNDALLET